jgi:hypothetical protein
MKSPDTPIILAPRPETPVSSESGSCPTTPRRCPMTVLSGLWLLRIEHL